MTIVVCDRCRAEVLDAPQLPLAIRGDFLSEKGVAAVSDLIVHLTFTRWVRDTERPVDLCAPCFESAIDEAMRLWLASRERLLKLAEEVH